MSISKRLKELRNLHKLSRREMAEIIGIKERAVLSYEIDESNPPYDVLIKFADYFNVSTDYLLCRTDIKEQARNDLSSTMGISEQSKRMSKNMPDLIKQLPEHLQNAFCQILYTLVENELALEKERGVIEQDFEPEEIVYEFPVSSFSAAAAYNGAGIPLDEDNEIEKRKFKLPKDIHRKDLYKCFVIRAKGNSMEPVIYDGDYMLIHPELQVEFGDIGVFVINDEGVVKQLQQGFLHSLNKECSDIYITEDTVAVGKYLGTVELID